MDSMGLNDRQRKAVLHVKQKGSISNMIYQTLADVSKRTAHRDLTDLVEKGAFQKVGKTGKGTFYELRKGAIKGPKGPKGPQKDMEYGVLKLDTNWTNRTQKDSWMQNASNGYWNPVSECHASRCR